MKTPKPRTEIERWGVSLEAIQGLEERLIRYYDKYRIGLMTQTDDTSEYGYHYLSSLLRMETK